MAGLAGTPADVVARFAALKKLVVEHIIVAMPFRLDERHAIIETLAREVMPRVGAAAGR